MRYRHDFREKKEFAILMPIGGGILFLGSIVMLIPWLISRSIINDNQSFLTGKQLPAGMGLLFSEHLVWVIVGFAAVALLSLLFFFLRKKRGYRMEGFFAVFVRIYGALFVAAGAALAIWAVAGVVLLCVGMGEFAKQFAGYPIPLFFLFMISGLIFGSGAFVAGIGSFDS